MDNYNVEFSSYSDEFLSKSNKSIRKRIVEKIDWLVENFDQISHLSRQS